MSKVIIITYNKNGVVKGSRSSNNYNSNNVIEFMINKMLIIKLVRERTIIIHNRVTNNSFKKDCKI